MKILPVIMCGGAGTRVWPESRETLPKQFIPLIGERSTFQMAIAMLDDPVFETPVVISNFDYRFLINDQLEQIGAKAEIVLEPRRRESGPAVAVAAGIAAAQGADTI
ncbi:MAG: mannose-phosphate guanylyltransferase / mannose-6-phosphate isomerase, partial [Methylobacteriaceae bacterium]|nr:mannose-phosphate guanylyltransferase / mannose-6-phosphate isomerase [Methylobacteriaceae bacterium]